MTPSNRERQMVPYEEYAALRDSIPCYECSACGAKYKLSICPSFCPKCGVNHDDPSPMTSLEPFAVPAIHWEDGKGWVNEKGEVILGAALSTGAPAAQMARRIAALAPVAREIDRQTFAAAIEKILMLPEAECDNSSCDCPEPMLSKSTKCDFCGKKVKAN